MDEKFLWQRIAETKTEIFPLDRLLPLETVYSIFEDEYAKTVDKHIFFKDRRYQRLREGYFAIFVALSIMDPANKPHYLVFPSNPSNDLYVASRMSVEQNGTIPKLLAYEFDIKEFTNWSPNFRDFTIEKIIPRIGSYNIAIPTYRAIQRKDLEILVQHLNTYNLNSKIWILGKVTDDDYDYTSSRVSIFSKDGLIYDNVINLNKELDRTAPRLVYQDVIRFK